MRVLRSFAKPIISQIGTDDRTFESLANDNVSPQLLLKADLTDRRSTRKLHRVRRQNPLQPIPPQIEVTVDHCTC